MNILAELEDGTWWWLMRVEADKLKSLSHTGWPGDESNKKEDIEKIKRGEIKPYWTLIKKREIIRLIDKCTHY